MIVESWKLSRPEKIGLLDVVHNVQPTVLIGVSGQAGAFSEPIVRAMAECNKRPVIFPLSNPTSREEATAADIEAWTEGRALIGVGSPFPPIMRDGSRFKVDQTNNSYSFPVSASARWRSAPSASADLARVSLAGMKRPDVVAMR